MLIYLVVVLMYLVVMLIYIYIFEDDLVELLTWVIILKFNYYIFTDNYFILHQVQFLWIMEWLKQVRLEVMVSVHLPMTNKAFLNKCLT